MGIKKTAARAIGALGGAALFEALAPHRARVLFYHGVSKEPLVHPVVQANQITFDAFRRQIDYFAKRFRFLTPDEFSERFASKTLGSKDLLLTFDDGYVNTAEVVAPYLFEKKIPFLVFMSPHLTETGGRIPSYYAFVAAYDPALAALDLETTQERLPLGTEEERFSAAMRLLEHIRALDETKLATLLDELNSVMSSDSREESWERYSSEALMTWSQAESLAREGAVLGSHCFGHTILHAGQSDSEVDRQLESSRAAIAEHIGACDYMSYPNGSREYVSPYAERRAGELYKTCFGVTGTQVKSTDVASFVSRVGLFGDFYGSLSVFSILSMLR